MCGTACVAYCHVRVCVTREWRIFTPRARALVSDMCGREMRHITGRQPSWARHAGERHLGCMHTPRLILAPPPPRALSSLSRATLWAQSDAPQPLWAAQPAPKAMPRPQPRPASAGRATAAHSKSAPRPASSETTTARSSTFFAEARASAKKGPMRSAHRRMLATTAPHKRRSNGRPAQRAAWHLHCAR